MSKTFTYSRQCGPSYYSEQTDEEFYDTEDFEYEVDSSSIREALSEIITDDYFSKIPAVKNNKELKSEIEKAVASFIGDNDLEDDLADAYEDELKEHFEEEAFDSLDD